MALLRGLLKAGIAKKVYDEARKPHNQEKLKQAYRQVAARRGGRGTPRG